MPDEILIQPHGPLLKLLEYYSLACIGELPAQRETLLRQRIQQTYQAQILSKYRVFSQSVTALLKASVSSRA